MLSANMLSNSVLISLVSVVAFSSNRDLLFTNTSSADLVECGGDCECPSVDSSTGNPCVLQCDEELECDAAILECRSGDACEVLCEAANACASDSEIHAEESTCVDISCSGSESCKDSLMNGGTQNFTVICFGASACEDSTISGINSLDVNVECEGASACKGSTEILSGSCDFNVLCEGEESCQDALIDGSRAVAVSLACIGENACTGATEFRCGTGACRLYCDDNATACDDLTVVTAGASSFTCAGNCFAEDIPDDFGDEENGDYPAICSGEIIATTDFVTSTFAPDTTTSSTTTSTSTTSSGSTTTSSSNTGGSTGSTEESTYEPYSSTYEPYSSTDSYESNKGYGDGDDNVRVNIYVGQEKPKTKKEYY